MYSLLTAVKGSVPGEPMEKLAISPLLSPGDPLLFNSWECNLFKNMSNLWHQTVALRNSKVVNVCFNFLLCTWKANLCTDTQHQKNLTSCDEKQAKLLFKNFIKSMKSVCKCLKEGPGNGAGFTAGQDSKSFVVTVASSSVEDKCLTSSVLKDTKLPLDASH